MSPVLGLPGPHPGPQNRTLSLFFHPSISLNLSIMYLRYPNYKNMVHKMYASIQYKFIQCKSIDKQCACELTLYQTLSEIYQKDDQLTLIDL